MLTRMDDTLWHQTAEPFAHVETSDPRFFDRYWFNVVAPDGRTSIQFTMGAYRNMNVLDAGVVVAVRQPAHCVFHIPRNGLRKHLRPDLGGGS